MPKNHKLLYLTAAAVVIAVGLSFIWQLGENYDIDKTSPNGLYRVKIEIRAEEGKDTTRGYIEHGKVEFLKGQEVTHSEEWRNPYRYEPTFREACPIVEWVGDSVLRMGQDRRDQPFYDDLIVSNNTDELFTYVTVSYGKYESFRIIDLAPKSQVTLRASPRFKPDHSSNYFVGYVGVTQSGKKFDGSMERTQRKSSADGPLKFEITINPNHLR